MRPVGDQAREETGSLGLSCFAMGSARESVAIGEGRPQIPRRIGSLSPVPKNTETLPEAETAVHARRPEKTRFSSQLDSRPISRMPRRTRAAVRTAKALGRRGTIALEPGGALETGITLELVSWVSCFSPAFAFSIMCERIGVVRSGLRGLRRSPHQYDWPSLKIGRVHSPLLCRIGSVVASRRTRGAISFRHRFLQGALSLG